MKKLIVLSVLLSLVIVGFSGCGSSNGGDDVGFTISVQGNPEFPQATVGYSARSHLPVEVTNLGRASITVNIGIIGNDADSFDLSDDSLNIPARASRIFSVVPQRGLPVETYEATVTLNAAGVPARSFDVSFTVTTDVVPERHVFLAFGQSNMQGPGPIRAQDTENVSERWQVMNVVPGTYAGGTRTRGQWYTAVPPLIIPDANLPHWQHAFSTGLSPLDHFGRTLVANTPEHITIGVIPVAHGDLALAAFHRTRAVDYFDPSYDGGREYHGPEANLQPRPSITERQGWDRYINAGYTSLFHAIFMNALPSVFRAGDIIKGIIVHQGESGRGLTYTSWPEMLREIYDDMLEALNLAPNSIPILLGQTWNAGSGQTGGMLNIDNRIQDYIPNAWVISSEGLTAGRPVNDNLHFGSADLEEFGRRYANKVLYLLYD